MPTVTVISLQPSISPKYFDLLNNEKMCDVTIITQGYMLHAHKVVLAAISTYFEEIFAIIPTEKYPAIVLSEVPHTFLSLMMEFIYCGRVDVDEQDVPRFQKILKNLRMDSVVQVKPQPSYQSQQQPIDTSLLIPEIKIKEEKLEEEEFEQEERLDEAFSDYENNAPESEDFKPVLTSSQKIAKIRANLSKTLSHKRRIPMLLNMPRRRTRIEQVVKDELSRSFMEEHLDICPFCKKKAKTMKHRNEHVKYCSSNPDRVVSNCPYCEKSFCDPYYVRKHIKTIHTNKRGLLKFDKTFKSELFLKHDR